MRQTARVSEVEVALDPAEAFRVFTEEIDLWWQRGPINNWDAARVVEMRCEPGVGGRLLEIYNTEGTDHLEIARITIWEPGDRLGWQSSVDDVSLLVRFDATGSGTRVSLEASIPAGGRDAGGTSFVRVVPSWFGAWTRERDHVEHRVHETSRLALAVYYADPARAAVWLKDVFGLRPALELADDTNGVGWIEFRVGDGVLIVLKRPSKSSRGELTHEPWIFVDDLDRHLARARKAGAAIVEEIHQHGYRAYSAEDPEGNRWTFAQARPTMH